MKKRKRKLPLPLLFALGGALCGLIYHRMAVCADGMCPLSHSPLLSVVCLAVIGWLLSGLFEPWKWTEGPSPETSAE